MRAAMYYGNHKLEIEDVPEPTAGDGEVKVRVSRNGICGTDLHEYYDGPIFIPPDQPHPLTGKAMPLVIGLMTQGHYDTTGWVDTIPMSGVLEQGFEELRAGRKMKLLVDPTA